MQAISIGDTIEYQYGSIVTSRAHDVSVRAVPERYGWTLRVLLVVPVLYGLTAVATMVGQVVRLVTWLQPHARGVVLQRDVDGLV